LTINIYLQSINIIELTDMHCRAAAELRPGESYPQLIFIWGHLPAVVLGRLWATVPKVKLASSRALQVLPSRTRDLTFVLLVIVIGPVYLTAVGATALPAMGELTP
jgi:hypothetical protein